MTSMLKRYGQSRALLCGILLLLQVAGNAGSLWGQTPLDWKPFGIDAALLPDFSAELRQRLPLPERDAIGWLDGSGFGLERLRTQEDRLAPETRFGIFRLFLSRHREFSGADRDIQRPYGAGPGTFDSLRNLPEDLRNRPGRAFERMGEIFQPQLNLEIEF